MRVSVDREHCIGAGVCVLIAPEVFDQDDGGVVLLRDATPPADQHPAVLEAVTRCPASVIAVSPAQP